MSGEERTRKFTLVSYDQILQFDCAKCVRKLCAPLRRHKYREMTNSVGQRSVINFSTPHCSTTYYFQSNFYAQIQPFLKQVYQYDFFRLKIGKRENVVQVEHFFFGFFTVQRVDTVFLKTIKNMLMQLDGFQ